MRFLCVLIGSLLGISSPLSALILIEDVMSPKDQEETGVSKLTRMEKLYLEKWLNKKFILKSEKEQINDTTSLYVSEIINQGQQLRLSNNSLYEIVPDDWELAQAWIAPTVVRVTFSNDPYYPWTITNPLSGYSVRGRLIGTERPQFLPPVQPQPSIPSEEAPSELPQEQPQPQDQSASPPPQELPPSQEEELQTQEAVPQQTAPSKQTP